MAGYRSLTRGGETFVLREIQRKIGYVLRHHHPFSGQSVFYNQRNGSLKLWGGNVQKLQFLMIPIKMRRQRGGKQKAGIVFLLNSPGSNVYLKLKCQSVFLIGSKVTVCNRNRDTQHSR